MVKERRYYKKDNKVFMVCDQVTTDVTDQYHNAHAVTREKHPDIIEGTIPYYRRFYNEFYSYFE